VARAHVRSPDAIQAWEQPLWGDLDIVKTFERSGRASSTIDASVGQGAGMGYQPRQRGFTLIELLIVVAIIALLVSILLPSLSLAREYAKIAVCEAHQRGLVSAWYMYADDNNGLLCGAGATNKYLWVKHGNTLDDIRKGLLWPYTGNQDLYHCESDHSEFTCQAKHLVSYSLSDYFGGDNKKPGGYKPVYQADWAQKLSETFVFIEEEDPRDWNKDSFLIRTDAEYWIDVPGDWHLAGATLSFGDGHAEYWEWKDPRTIGMNRLDMYAPGSPDLRRVLKAFFPGWKGYGQQPGFYSTECNY
jgi:prepilin-type N-terminal cleavage/methylation domain-containing protein